MRISLSPDPNLDTRSPPTAMIRYVVSDSGSLTSTDAWPEASVVTEPSQNASTRKSFLTVAVLALIPPPPPSSVPLGVNTRRLMTRCRLSVFMTCSAFGT